MLDGPQYDFITTELDPNFLSTPFVVQTNWHVITGAPCSGKTTLIDQLADKGFQTVPEVARQYFEREMAKGRTIAEIREEPVALERHLIDLQLKIEGRLPANDLTFLDRAFPDCLSFCRVLGMSPNEILLECFHHRYASVFLLDRLPFQRSKQLGPEDVASARFLDEWLARDYNILGYRVVRVPVLSPDERLSFVLEMLSAASLI
jgi:predicted ATPase